MNFPKYLSIQTTSLCNASCVFCPYQDIKDLFPAKIMEAELYKKIIDECSGYRDIKRIILYMNNESLTDPFLIDRINYAKEKLPWADVHILTNGILLTKETAEKLINSKLDWIGISFHGIRKKTVESAMGIPFEITLKRINNFIERANHKKNIKDYVMITFLKHEYLKEVEKEEAINYWKQKGIERISYFDGPISRAGNVKDLPKVYRKEKIVGCGSIWADEMLHIVEDGKVVLCCMDWRRQVVLGDLNKENISEIWNGKRKDIWETIHGREGMPNNFLCKRCEEAIIGEKKKKILLVIAPCWGIDTPPLGLASISSYLKSKGMDAEVLDLNIEIYNLVSPRLRQLWDMRNSNLWWVSSLFYRHIKPQLEAEIEWAAKKIIEKDIDIVGFSVYAPNRLFTKEVIKIIKDNSRKTVIVGGRGIYDILERKNFYQGSIDYFIVGEGEDVLYRFLTGERNIEGLIDDLGSKIVPVFLKDLSNFSMLTYENFDLSKYKKKELCLLMNRGCLFQCTFCNDWRYIGKLRTRKAEDVFSEIEHLFYKTGIRKFYFNDQAINVNLKELNRLCDLLIEAPFKIEWIALAIPWKFLTKEILVKMKNAGCITLNYGIESGSDRVLKTMNKEITIKEAESVLRDTKEAGINTQLNFIVGFPGETEEDFKNTKEFIKRNRNNISGFTNLNMCNVVLGSELMIKKELYDISLPDTLEKMDTHWSTKDKANTPEIRSQRLKELVDLSKEYRLPLFTTNISGSSGPAKEADILLLLCPMWDISLPPLGIGYLVSYLKSKDIVVDIFDINIDAYVSSAPSAKALWKMENYRLWNDRRLFETHTLPLFDNRIDDYVNKILSLDIDILGFSVNAANLLFSIELAKRVRQKDPAKTIIFGGPHSKWFKADINYLEKHRDAYRGFYAGLVDIFVIGEGEKTLAEIIECYKKDIEPDGVPGTIFYKDKKYISQEDDNLIENVDELPYPDFGWADFLKYSDKRIPILLSRGCIRKCAFCNDTFVSSRYRCRTAENVFKEIEFRVNNERIDNFIFNDLILNGNLRELEKLCGLLIKHKIDIRYTGQFGIRKDMDRRLLIKLKKSGCEAITYGVENFSNKVLKLMRKPYTCEDAQMVLKDTKKAEIDVYINVVVGFPGEGQDEFNENVEAIRNSTKYIKGISSLAPCLVTLGSDLQVNFKKYNIVFPEIERADAYFRWYTEDGNTYNLRKERVKAIESMMSESGLSISVINLYDREDQESSPQGIAPKTEPRLSADFLLVNLPPWAQENPHIGIGYLSAYLRSKGINFRILDLNKSFFISHPDFQRLWHVENKNFWSNENTFPLVREIFKKDIDRAIDEILSIDCNILGFSVVDPKERLTIEFINTIKQRSPNKKIILGGPATSTYEQRKIFLDNVGEYVNVFVVGEGEESLFYLLNRLLQNKDIMDVEGCYARDNGKWIYKARNTLVLLDQIPFPTYEEFDLNLYGKSLLVEWSRGCRGKCTFCKNYRLFSAYRSKSPDRIIDELRYHKERHNIDGFTVSDNILNGDLKKLREVCNEIVDQNLKIKWTGQIAPHRNMDSDFFKSMKEAGCFKLQIGLESGSNHVLRAMQKTFTAEVSERNIRFAKKAGIETEIFVMVGFPSETEKDFRQSYDFIRRNARYIDTVKSINTLHLIAGTDVYENRERFRIKALPEKDWHYLWETYDGNNYKVRKERAQRLLDLSCKSGLRVMETNIQEGKEGIFEIIKGKKDLNEGSLLLKDSVNNLQELPQKRTLVRKRRGARKWIIGIFLAFYTFFYIVYFWVYMGFRNKALLGGRKNDLNQR